MTGLIFSTAVPAVRPTETSTRVVTSTGVVRRLSWARHGQFGQCQLRSAQVSEGRFRPLQELGAQRQRPRHAGLADKLSDDDVANLWAYVRGG